MRTNYLKVCICHKYTTKIFNKNCLNQQYSCSSLKRLLQIWSSTFYGPFLWMGFNYFKVTDPRREDSLLFATKSPEIPGTESIYLWKLKGWVNLEFTQWFWTQDAWMWMLGYCSIWLRLMDAIQLSQGYRINTKRVCFSLQSPSSSWYTFDRPQKDERVSWLWNHPVVLNLRLVDWESSAKTTRPLL